MTKELQDREAEIQRKAEQHERELEAQRMKEQERLKKELEEKEQEMHQKLEFEILKLQEEKVSIEMSIRGSLVKQNSQQDIQVS